MIEVHHNPPELRYELLLDGRLVAHIRYRREPGALALVHTDIEPAYDGMGLAGELVEGALIDIRGQGSHVIPVCPYVGDWIRGHPDYGRPRRGRPGHPRLRRDGGRAAAPASIGSSSAWIDPSSRSW